jgi:uncharacterized protein (DUF952 family)
MSVTNKQDQHPAHVYHIVSEADLKKCTSDGMYAPSSLESEGFIHCSKLGQVKGAATRYYQNASELTVLKLDVAAFTSSESATTDSKNMSSHDNITPRLVYEDTVGTGEQFPHVYGSLPLSSIVGKTRYTKDADGVYHTPRFAAAHSETE